MDDLGQSERSESKNKRSKARQVKRGNGEKDGDKGKMRIKGGKKMQRHTEEWSRGK